MEHKSYLWHTNLREDGVRVELICPHGVGHPSKKLSKPGWQDWMSIHGCDGCCTKMGFLMTETAHLLKDK